MDNSTPSDPQPPQGSQPPPPASPAVNFDKPSESSAPPPPVPPSPGPGPAPTPQQKEERLWACLTHLSPLAGVLVGSMTGPFAAVFAVIPPLIVWQIKKDTNSFIADQAKEALNFQICLTAINLVLLVLSFTVVLACITVPAMILLGVAGLVLMIIAAIKANEGVSYRYPYIHRLVQ